jgi:hypothetical protein
MCLLKAEQNEGEQIWISDIQTRNIFESVGRFEQLERF